NNLGDSVSIINTATGATRVTTPVGHNPYTVALSGDGKTAYVSNWGGKTVSVVDAQTGAAKGEIAVGTHPSAMTLDRSSGRLYVANSDSDNVSVIDTATNGVLQTIELAPYPGAQVGASPNALGLAADGKRLLAANAGCMPVAGGELPGGDGRGVYPAGWDPAGVAAANAGPTLYVAYAEGVGGGPNGTGPSPNGDQPPNQYVGSMIQGTLSIIP